MPIKFKCKCGQVLSVPDTMAGKNGKCPKCKEALRVPAPSVAAPKASSASASSSVKAAVPKAKTASAPSKAKPAASVAAQALGSGGAFGGLDSLFEDAGLTQRKGPVCPQCSKDIKPGTVICTACGFHFETGEQLKGFNASVTGPEFDNEFLQEASENMKRDLLMDDRRSKAAMPWWVLMSFFIGAVTLCLAGVIIVDGKFGEPADASTFFGKLQRWPVFTTLGLTAGITGVAISIFAHLSICAYGFSQSAKQGLACMFLPLIYSLIYGIMNWTNNKAPIKAIGMALVFIGLGTFLIIQGGGFQLIIDAF